MKLGARIFFLYLAVFALCFYFPINWVLDNLRERYLEGMEDPLVDQANILAGIISHEMEMGRFSPEQLDRIFENVYSQNLSVKIYELLKTTVDARIYITDISGVVIFDSKNKRNVGRDLSQWRDVHLTLNGKYGARSTRQNPNDSTSSELYVAAPILVEKRLAGVLTVIKPTTNIEYFLRKAKHQIFQIGLISLAAAVLLSLVVSILIINPVIRLTRYANGITGGNRLPVPKLDKSEIGEMGRAFVKMQEALEGKKYVEHYVQNLTHEIKSPLSAIRGAAELLEENVPNERRKRFLANIKNETNRVQEIVERMLELTALETRGRIQSRKQVSIDNLLIKVLESKQPLMLQKKLASDIQIPTGIHIMGDEFLLHQALSNLIQNAVDFSPIGARITINGRLDNKILTIDILDSGPGIPDFAKDKIFNKFFSLTRPDTGKKSTGLGLNFVREIALIHGGTIQLHNLQGKGTCASLALPAL